MEPHTTDTKTPEYTSLRDALSFLNSIENENVSLMNSVLLAQQITSAGVEKELAALGIRKFRPLAKGNHADVFEIGNGQIVRISKDNGVPLPETPEHLQSIQEYKIGRMLVEVMPKLTPGSATSREALDQIEAHYKERGYETNDLRNPNDAAMMSDGKTALSTDREALEQGNIYTFHPEKDARWVVPKFGWEEESIFSSLHGTGFTSLQERLYPAIHDKRVRGVLTDEDRTRLENGELNLLKQEKPECFLLLREERLPQGQLSDADAELCQRGGIFALHKKHPEYFYEITPTTLPKFMHQVFDRGLYPEQAMEWFSYHHVHAHDDGYQDSPHTDLVPPYRQYNTHAQRQFIRGAMANNQWVKIVHSPGSKWENGL